MECNNNTYKAVLDEGDLILHQAGIENARLDAWYLLEHVTGLTRSEFFFRGGDVMDASLCETYKELIEKRAKHVPLQYITGHQEFMGLDFVVSPAVLIPRQDTEILVEEVEKVCAGKRVLDMCTGSGCIAISLKKRGQVTHAAAADISLKALAVAKENAARNKADISFIHSDMFTHIEEKYDIIVSNPPYIETEVIKGLMPEVKDFEPLGALDGDEDGLKFYRILAKESKDYLTENGMLFLEIGCEQAKDVSELLVENGFENIRVVKDYAGLDRVVAAQLKS
ncbi:MAG: peptide chain release factor N(5)-glutamine methyltransferase [Lachnospiraceae bacterium]|nr:peptide chain release factor N(5)-glutamine methyltransferase [Lachnospiraceae bacterium]